ncbi:MAG: sulfotransferase [Thauera sp.]|nr:MAG: sulfotransferase [Thauera sp.]
MLSKLAKLRDREIVVKNLVELKRDARGLWWDLTRPAAKPPVFLVGCSRSGTTVTFETIGASTELVNLGFEIPQFWNDLYGPLNNGWHSEAAGAEHALPEHRDAALRFFYRRLGGGRILDKTCINVMRIGYLHALFPEAKFVFIQRDGRDNISSMIDGWRLGRTDGEFQLTQFFGDFPCPVSINGGEFKEWAFFLAPGWQAYSSAPIEEVCAFQWISANQLALDAAAALPADRWIHLRYEDLFERPVDMFRDVYARLDLAFTPDIEQRCRTLDQRPTSIVKGKPAKAKWKQQNPELIERILDRIAPMQTRLGYDNAS